MMDGVGRWVYEVDMVCGCGVEGGSGGKGFVDWDGPADWRRG